MNHGLAVNEEDSQIKGYGIESLLDPYTRYIDGKLIMVAEWDVQKNNLRKMFLKNNYFYFYSKGALRFSSPVPVKPWGYILDASHPPNSCMQERIENFGKFRGTELLNHNTQVSEDCLYLNVHAPAGNKEVNKYNFIWIYIQKGVIKHFFYSNTMKQEKGLTFLTSKTPYP